MPPTPLPTASFALLPVSATEIEPSGLISMTSHSPALQVHQLLAVWQTQLLQLLQLTAWSMTLNSPTTTSHANLVELPLKQLKSHSKMLPKTLNLVFLLWVQLRLISPALACAVPLTCTPSQRSAEVPQDRTAPWLFPSSLTTSHQKCHAGAGPSESWYFSYRSSVHFCGEAKETNLTPPSLENEMQAL